MSLRIFRISNIFAWSLAVLCGSLLFYVSQSVQRSEDELRRLNHIVNLELEAIRVLEAEWDYLNSPLRLEELAAGYLPIGDMSAEQMITNMADVPEPERVVLPPMKPITVSMGASNQIVPKEVKETSHADNSIIRNADRDQFNSLLQGLVEDDDEVSE